MKKIPTLFERIFENHRVVDITDKIAPGCEEAFLHGVATVKIDGSCCAIFNGIPYKRYDAKKGKKPPVRGIPCCDPDPVTGHWPHWVELDPKNPGDKWFWAAFISNDEHYPDGTYEAIGPHFQGNPYGLSEDIMEQHGKRIIEGLRRDFKSVKKYLSEHDIEGIVFWLNGEPVCKIKRTDFGFDWPVKK